MEEPDILLLDEPFNALDEQSCKVVKELIIQQRNRGATVVVVSHELDIIRNNCDVLMKMADGELIVQNKQIT